MMEKIITGAIGVVILSIALFLSSSNLKDLKDTKKAEKTINHLVELRVALEKYYQLTGHYPELCREGAKDDLKILDYVDENGKRISFAEIYGKNTIPTTPKTEKFPASNHIFNTRNFDNGTNRGGWNYDYINFSGEIHANLPENSYNQGIKWMEY